MKLIMTGATGFVGTEVIRQALNHPSITSIIALSRKELPVPQNENTLEASKRKLQCVILKDWNSSYPDSVKEYLKYADACIWNLAVTPTKSREMDFAEVTDICYNYTVHGIESMAPLANKPFRFVYTSGLLVERDQNKTLPMMGDYLHMRGRVETAIVEYAAKHSPDVQVTCARPGLIDGPGREHASTLLKTLQEQVGYSPGLHISELAAFMLDQCLHDIRKDFVEIPEMVETSSKLLKEADYLR